MKEKNHLFSATGIPSLFLIFGVLMLVILSLLGYGTSRQDLRASSLSLEQTSAYYNACSYNRIPGEDPGDIVATGHVQSCIIRYSTVRGNDIRGNGIRGNGIRSCGIRSCDIRGCGISRTDSPEYRNFHSQTLGVGKCSHIFSSMFL